MVHVAGSTFSLKNCSCVKGRAVPTVPAGGIVVEVGLCAGWANVDTSDGEQRGGVVR